MHNQSKQKVVAVAVAVSFNVKHAHAELMQCAEDVYDAASVTESASAQALELIQEVREALPAKKFAAWVLSELGSGGSTKTDGYHEGAIPQALRAEGRLRSVGKIEKGSAEDKGSAALNSFVSRLRTTAKYAAENPAFKFVGMALSSAARAAVAGSGTAGTSNRTGTGRRSNTETQPGEVVTLEKFRAFAHDHLAVALEACILELRARNRKLNASALEAIRSELVANS